MTRYLYARGGFVILPVCGEPKGKLTDSKANAYTFIRNCGRDLYFTDRCDYLIALSCDNAVVSKVLVISRKELEDSLEYLSLLPFDIGPAYINIYMTDIEVLAPILDQLSIKGILDTISIDFIKQHIE